MIKGSTKFHFFLIILIIMTESAVSQTEFIELLDDNKIEFSQILDFKNNRIYIYAKKQNTIYTIPRDKPRLQKYQQIDLDTNIFYYNEKDDLIFYTEGFDSGYTSFIIKDNDETKFDNKMIGDVCKTKVLMTEFEPIEANSRVYLYDLRTEKKEILSFRAQKVNFKTKNCFIFTKYNNKNQHFEINMFKKTSERLNKLHQSKNWIKLINNYKETESIYFSEKRILKKLSNGSINTITSLKGVSSFKVLDNFLFAIKGTKLLYLNLDE